MNLQLHFSILQIITIKKNPSTLQFKIVLTHVRFKDHIKAK